MRIAIGQLWQETNTFNPLPTTRTDFEAFGIIRGGDLIEKMADTNELGGFIQSLRSWPEGPEILGMVRLPAWPSGPATPETFDWLMGEMIEGLEKVLPVNGVLLALHGALVSKSHPDVEGEVLRAIRERIGPAVPLVATLDLHANVTDRMVRAADALVLYHTAPHVDVFETGCRGAAVLRRILVDGARPQTAFRKLPLVVPAERANTQDSSSVSSHFRQVLQEMEKEPRVMTAGLATVQPWLDIPDMGTSVLVVTDDSRDLAEDRCNSLASEVWNRRREYLPDLVPVPEAVRLAFENPTGLTVLGDGADATTSGAPGDSTHLLAEILRYEWTRPALVPLVAPEVVEKARAMGVGKEWTTRLGGVLDHRFSHSLEVAVTIESLFEARFVMSGHLARNLAIDMGPGAVLRCGNVYVLATSRSGPHFAPDFFRSAGQEPFDAAVVVAKSPCGFRAAYQGRAVRIIQVRSPGCAPSDFWNYEYLRIPRPMWPWDDREWSPTGGG